MTATATDHSSGVKPRFPSRFLVALILPVLCGALLAFSFPPYDAHGGSYLAWIALVPFGFAMRVRPCAELYVGAYIGGLAFHLWHLDTVRTAYGGTGLSGTYIYHWVAQGVIMGCFWPLGLWLGRRLVRATGWPMVVCLPLAWLAFEFIRRCATMVFDGNGFPLGQLGLTQGNPYWMQLADLGGIGAVSFLVAMVNGAIVDLFTSSEPARRRSVLAATMALLTAWSYGAWRLSQDVTQSGPIVTVMPGTAAAYAYRNDKRPPGDLLVWTEDAGLLIEEGDSEIDEFYSRIARHSDAVIAVNAKYRLKNGRSHNSTLFFDPSGYVGRYDKMMLVIFTEKPPSYARLFSSEGRGLTSGTSCRVFEVRNGGSEFRVAATICYDVCFGQPFQRAMVENPDFFVLPGSEQHDRTGRIAEVLLRFAQYRAIECRRAIIRSTEDGFSGLIDGNGRLLEGVPPGFTEPAPVGRVPCDRRMAPFSFVSRQLGDWPGLTSVLLVVLGILTHGFRHRSGECRPRSAGEH